MYKYAIIGGSFVVAVAALVLLQPGAKEVEVALPSAPQPAPQEMTAPITSVANVSAVVSAPAPQPANRPADDNLLDLTNSVLTGLGVAPKSAQAPAAKTEQNDLRAMTSSVLAGLGVSPTPTPEAQPGVAGASDDQIRALLSEAIDRGLIAVPKALRTPEGDVDKDTLITQLARAATGETAEAPSEDLIAGGKGVEVRVVQQAGKTVQYRFYTVQRGDSLGAIAHKFYGDAAEYTRIYDANRRLLPSPDQIRVGQRLTIPSLTDA